MPSLSLSKHGQVFAALSEEIGRGRWRPGERMPSEADLVARFGVSRITVSRAMRDLKAAGLVQRRPGSGTYVTDRKSAGARSFGLLIPDLGESEIFEPICQGMMASPFARRHALLWGNSAAGSPAGDPRSKAACAWRLCRQFIERKVSGVFFAPLEHEPGQDEVNLRIINALDRARIPVVLLDRPVRPFPEPPAHDLIGIDNRAAGFVAAEHLLGLGARRIHFMALAGAASTVDDREAGFREALFARDMPFARALVHRLAGYDDEAVRSIMASPQPDGIVCANDRTAAQLMHALRRSGFGIPQDVRLIGIDDVEYAGLLPVPLTSLRQPARQIGDTALGRMLERIERPDLPPVELRLHCELIVRDSCGARPAV